MSTDKEFSDIKKTSIHEDELNNWRKEIKQLSENSYNKNGSANSKDKSTAWEKYLVNLSQKAKSTYEEELAFFTDINPNIQEILDVNRLFKLVPHEYGSESREILIGRLKRAFMGLLTDLEKDLSYNKKFLLEQHAKKTLRILKALNINDEDMKKYYDDPFWNQKW